MGDNRDNSLDSRYWGFVPRGQHRRARLSSSGRISPAHRVWVLSTEHESGASDDTVTRRRCERACSTAFANPKLLELALSAITVSFGSSHNERLEIRGDSVLNHGSLRIARTTACMTKPEGDFSRVRANLVKQETLHQLGLWNWAGLGHGPLGEGEAALGGQQRPSILADALEAVIGAVFWTRAYEAGADLGACACLTMWKFTPHMTSRGQRPENRIGKSGCKVARLQLPSYRVVGTTRCGAPTNLRCRMRNP